MRRGAAGGGTRTRGAAQVDDAKLIGIRARGRRRRAIGEQLFELFQTRLRSANGRRAGRTFGNKSVGQPRQNSAARLFSSISPAINQHNASRPAQRAKKQQGILTALPDKPLGRDRKHIRMQ
jgi:hypothetical protein